jgi:hypothetical protein
VTSAADPGGPPAMGARRPVLAGSLVLGAMALTAACTWIPVGAVGPGGENPSEARFHLAMSAVQRDDYGAATRELRELAGECESGAWGRNAVLALASLELSPRNPDGSPGAAARLAARYLQIRTAPAGSVAVAETLYLLALDLGASPVTDPLASSGGAEGTEIAFENCDRETEASVIRELPSHPGPSTTWATLRAARAQRDALTAAADSLAVLADSLALRTVELEAEIERIRRLLLPDTVRVGESSLPRRP